MSNWKKLTVNNILKAAAEGSEDKLKPDFIVTKFWSMPFATALCSIFKVSRSVNEIIAC